MTTLAEKIKTLNEQQQAVDKAYKELETEFWSAINDKKVPLYDRWQIFMDGPSKLKYQHPTDYHGRSKALQYARDHWFDATEVYGRGKVIKIAEMLDEFVYGGEIKGDAYAFGVETDEQSIPLLEGAMEELLSKRMETFTYDW